MYAGRQRPRVSLVHSYDSSDDEEQPTSTQPSVHHSVAPSSSSTIFNAIRPTAAPTSPPVSLDRAVQQFVSEVSVLVDGVEEEEAGQRRLLSVPGVRVYSHVDASSGRSYYFDATRQLSVWQQPTAADVEPWMDGTVAAPEPSATQTASAQPTPSTAQTSMERVVSDISQLLDRLDAAVEGQTEPCRVSAALLRLELRIRRGDWQASAVSEEYAEARLADLLNRTRRELDAAESRSTGARPCSPLIAEATVESVADSGTASPRADGGAAASQADVASAEGAAEPVGTVNASSAATSAAPPPGVRRRAGVVSKPPSNPTATPSPSPVPPPSTAVHPTAVPSFVPSSPMAASFAAASTAAAAAAAASGGKRRLEDSKGAVGAMVQRWKAVRLEADGEGGRVEQERQRQQEQRMRLAEAEVRNSAGAAHNPNLIAVSGDWRERVRERQQQPQQLKQ